MTTGSHSPSWSRLLLAVVIVLTWAIAIRHYDGHDFINNVWAPIHGLLDGRDPYDRADVAYFARYRVPVVAGLYLPAALTLHLPLAVLSAKRSADVMAALNAVLIWASVLLLVPPRTVRRCLVAAVAGTMVILSAAAQDTIYLGQFSAWALMGMALLAASLRRDASAVWLPALGVMLVALKPQSGIPLFIALGVLGYWRVLARAAAGLALASVPGALLFMRAAGTLDAMRRTVGENLALVSHLPPVDLANPANLRIDALGMVSQLGGAALSGPGWILLALAVASALLFFALRSSGDRGPQALADPYVLTLVTVYIATSLYHLMYDQLLLYAGPLAAVAVLPGDQPARPRLRAVAAGGVALMVVGVICRSGVRDAVVAAGLPTLWVHRAWVTVPTLLGVAVVVRGMLGNRGTPRSEMPGP